MTQILNNKQNFYDEIWTKPLWLGLFSVVVSVIFYTVYFLVAELDNYQEGLAPSVVIPAIVAPICALFIRRYVRKIKEQSRKMETLYATNRKLLSVLTHDLRSPLSSVKSAMELMFLGILEEHELERMGQKLTEDVDNVLKLQDQILEWAKRQEGIKAIEATHFEIGDPIWSVIEMYDQQIKAKELDIEVSHFNNTVYTDKEVFEFVFRNVFYNAIKFTPRGGEVTVRSYLKDSTCELYVEDTGIGMSPKLIDKIMNTNEFHSSLGTENEDGTGFGLNASLQYLRQCNSSLGVRSIPGVGSSFKISLPVRPVK